MNPLTFQEMVNNFRYDVKISSEGGKVYLRLKNYSSDDVFEVIGNTLVWIEEIGHNEHR